MTALEERLVEIALDKLLEVKMTAGKQAEEINDLEAELSSTQRACEQAENEKENLQRRLRRIGTECETPIENGHLRTVTAEAEGFARSCIADIDRDTQQTIEAVKTELATKLARDMIDNDYVQFEIHRNEGGPLDMHGKGRVSAKLFVFPWDAMGPKRVEVLREE